MTTTSIQATSQARVDGRGLDGVQNIGPGAPPPKKPVRSKATGSGNGAGPNTTQAPSVPRRTPNAAAPGATAAKQKSASRPVDPIAEALDRWQAVSKENVSGKNAAYNELFYILHARIGSCRPNGKCDFGAMRVVAEKIDVSVRNAADSSHLPRGEAISRQLAIREATYAVLLDAACVSMTILVKNPDAKDRATRISEVVGWVVEQQESPQYPNSYKRLKVLAESLINTANSREKDAAIGVVKDLAAKCRDRGNLTDTQMSEIGKLGRTVNKSP